MQSKPSSVTATGRCGLNDPMTAGEIIAGGKGAALRSLLRAGFPVPPFRILPADAAVPTADALVAAAAALAPSGTVIVRSSAEAEDGRVTAMAGRFVSVPGVDPTDGAALTEAFARVRASAADDAGRMAVILQREIAPRFAGVAFTVDPATGRRDRAVVSAVAGHGEQLVSGECTGRMWCVDRNGIIDAGAGEAVDCPPAVVKDVAAMARRVASRFGLPQDIEWAWDGETLFLVQARPVTTIAGMPDPAGVLRIWERSNIAESYAGVTTAMTFSFIRRAYAPVYRTFCRRMGVPPRGIAAAHGIFEGLLGFHGGRVTYNLLAWHALVALLPGYRFNGPFMEQMMGVGEDLPADAPRWIRQSLPPRPGPLRDLFDLGGALVGWGTAACGFGFMRDRFLRRVNHALADLPASIDELTGDEIAAHYRMLEQKLLQHWDAPIVNDLFCMVSFGILRSCCQKWTGRPELSAALVQHGSRGAVISVEPALAVRQIATRLHALARTNPVLLTTLMNGDSDTVAAIIRQHPQLVQAQNEYLARFGDRCLGELKLENPSLRQDPLPLWRQAAALAGRTPATGKTVVIKPDGPLSGLTMPGWKRWLLQRIGNWASRRLADRELLRYERTRVFGRVRDLLTTAGRLLWSEGRLASPQDVFHLEVHELLGAMEGTGATEDLAGLAAVRRAEYERNRALPPGADRFITRGPAHLVHPVIGEPPPLAEPAGDCRQGLGCSPGRSRGRVRLVDDPAELSGNPLAPGEILVCRRTDPGWAMVLAGCTAVVVEHGSMLSHAAIVARELSLPAVVGLPGLMDWLHDHDEIELDGTTGIVRVLESAH